MKSRNTISAFLLFTLLLPLSLYSQQLPNSSFEAWHTVPDAFGKEDPDGWMSTNRPTGFFGFRGISKSEDSYSGNYALKLIAIPYDHPDFVIAICNGKPEMTNADPPGIVLSTGGTPFQDRPLSLRGYYKHSIDSTRPDSAYAFVLLKKYNAATMSADTVAYGAHTFMPTADYTFFEIALSYKDSSLTPDTALSAFVFKTVQSNDFPSPKSVLLIDALSFKFSGSVNLAELSEMESISVYPNPTGGIFRIETPNPGQAVLTVYDFTGRKVRSHTVNTNDPIDFSTLNRGCYAVRLSQENKISHFRIILR